MSATNWSSLACCGADGTRCGVAFTSADLAGKALGPATGLIELTLPALHEMLAPLGVDRVQVDPDLVVREVGHRRVA